MRLIRSKEKSSLSQKFIALFLSFSLILCESISYAAPAHPERSEGPRSEILRPFGSQDDTGKIHIPESLGRLDESFDASRDTFHASQSSKMVIYIQDAHDSLEAQKHIAKMIRYFVARKGVRTVFEEGYDGPVPTDDYFGFMKDPSIKEKVSYFLMDKLRIGGAEYAHINRTQDFKLIGADSIKLHLKNIRWYRRMAQRQVEARKDLAAIQKEIQTLAHQSFPKELKEWMKLKERFDQNQVSLLDYVKRMTVLSRESWGMRKDISLTPNSSLMTHPIESYSRLSLLLLADRFPSAFPPFMYGQNEISRTPCGDTKPIFEGVYFLSASVTTGD